MNTAKIRLFPKLTSIYDKFCQSCTRVASADPQIFGSNINVGSERSERPISHTAPEFKKIRERQRTPSERSEQLSSSSYSGCDLWLCRFFSFRLSFPVRFSIHNSYYLEKAAFSERSVAGAWKGRLFEIIA